MGVQEGRITIACGVIVLADHDQECDELKVALQHDKIYNKGNQIHTMELQKPLWMNFWKGGMKKVLEEELTGRSNYASTARIQVGGTFKEKVSFWLEVLDTVEKSGFDEIWSKADDVRRLQDGNVMYTG